MNIGIVTTWFERGAAYVSKQYADVLSKENDIYIFARGGEEYALDDENWKQYHVHWAKSFKNQIATYFDLMEFETWIIENSIECILFNEQHWWQPILFCNRKNIKCGAYIDYYTTETIPFFEHYDFIICNTKRHFKVFKYHKQAYYLPWGTDINVFVPQTYELVEKNQVVFFHSAGYNPARKGTSQLIKVFDRLSKTYKGQCKLVIHSQVRLENNCPDISDILKNNDYICAIHNTVPAPGLYYLGDVYVYPSRLDGIGLTLPEALSCGLPAIVTDMEPMVEFGNEIIRKRIKINEFHARKDAYYWPEAIINENSLYKKMEFFVLHKQEIPELKKEARNYALRKLNWARNASNICSIFKNTNVLEHDMGDQRKIVEYENRITPFSTRFDICIANIKRIKDIISKYKDKQVFLYPYGEQTKRILKYIDFENINLIGIIDSKISACAGYNVFKLDILRKYSDATIIVSSFWYREEIIEEINQIKEFCGEIVVLFQNEQQLL